jgi:mono/diheme cytochrome c family protein
MRNARFRSSAVVVSVVVVSSVGIAGVLRGPGAEPARNDAHKDHPNMMHHVAPPAKKPALATPKGWRFALPSGNREAGRKAFADFECFKCHEVQGEHFPAPLPEQGGVGPALSGMGPMHPAEYFAEAIIDPNASAAWRIKHHKEEHKGYLGPDGKTKMPSYNGTMTVEQLIDLVAYLKSLTGPVEHKH